MRRKRKGSTHLAGLFPIWLIVVTFLSSSNLAAKTQTCGRWDWVWTSLRMTLELSSFQSMPTRKSRWDILKTYQFWLKKLFIFIYIILRVLIPVWGNTNNHITCKGPSPILKKVLEGFCQNFHSDTHIRSKLAVYYFSIEVNSPNSLFANYPILRESSDTYDVIIVFFCITMDSSTNWRLLHKSVNFLFFL